MNESSHSSMSSSFLPPKCGTVEETETQNETVTAGFHNMSPELLQQLVYDALVWSSLHGLVVGDRSVQE
uniref:Uncharacterized protein n=1 Tax=Nelumbo nucifera TaxID=4432 RepID=A0A822XZ67_NELNU|nr:TPA_asm: hypothetical protein HUJ06_025750 [Nelumbo nucifera]